VLGVLGLAVPMAVVVGRAASRLPSRRAQSVVAVAAVTFAAIACVVQGGFSHLLGSIVARNRYRAESREVGW
jgi:short subunit fatty acids transporter